MAIEVTRRARHRRMPWRNGGGTTHELASAGGRGVDDFDWRVSIAEVTAGGPFSSFPGVDRVITLLSGPWLDLKVDGAGHRLLPLEPFAFDGGAATSCEIAVPTEDLNLMTRRGAATGTVEVLDARAGATLAAPADDVLLLVCVAGTVAVRAGAGEQAVSRYDLATVVGEQSVQVQGDGSVAVVRVRPVAPEV